MDFRLSEDQRALRAGMRDLLAARFPREKLRKSAEADPAKRAPLDRALWRELGEIGMFSLRLSEKEGGAGLGLPEAVLVFEEAGRALLPGPLAATHLAAGLVPGAADGATVVTALEGDGVVEQLDAADAVLLLEGPTVRALPVDDGTGALAAARPLRSVDPTTPLHYLPPADEAMQGAERAGQAKGLAVGRLCGEAALLTAAQQLGSAARTLEMAVAYVKVRTQFARPIGAFQAVQHVCARLLARTEIARSSVYAASLTMTLGDTCAAKLLADEAAVRNARDCLQLHGGLGFTWDADVHLHLKRAWVRQAQWQSAAKAEEALAAALLEDPGDCMTETANRANGAV
ncbi:MULTISPECIES: acyl-CoA dehydrogenase family protein [Streptomyces]|uniref:Acyl-CoA/acyl-ACP dehydrogenase n=1 Tax=Streptomyces griseocarneus TaxID=51201 RepID=A0ABX7RG25_9ACTN|nr:MULTISPECIES: acyl-CoA dehydrogenase family protein [Streptomyces]QSY47150.1 acyl-CoA/acyl-ACP dehydrogenase [Streptomyces griseocarneus]